MHEALLHWQSVAGWAVRGLDSKAGSFTSIYEGAFPRTCTGLCEMNARFFGFEAEFVW